MSVQCKHFSNLNSCSKVALFSKSLCLIKKSPVLQVVGVSERRLVRRVGVLLVVTTTMKATMLMDPKGPAIASETVVLKGLTVRTTLAAAKMPF